MKYMIKSTDKLPANVRFIVKFTLKKNIKHFKTPLISRSIGCPEPMAEKTLPKLSIKKKL